MSPSTSPRLTRTALAVTLAATLLTAGAPSVSASETNVPRLKVLTYNTFLMSRAVYPSWGQDHRATEIPKAPFFHDNDVIVLQEAFDNSASDTLMSAAVAEYPYQTPVVGRSKAGWDATGGAYSSTTPEDGGVTVLSKWPILKQEQYIYKDACGADWWANKGFAYVVLDVNGTRVHIVGTHAQSTDSMCAAGEAARDRSRQFKEIDGFLDAKDIPAGEQVLVAGDLNVDSRTPEYASMLADADLLAADTRIGYPYSFDTHGNTITAYRYPNEAPEDLDYVLHRAGHARPANWSNEVIWESAAPWTARKSGKLRTFTSLSDHYPVTGS